MKKLLGKNIKLLIIGEGEVKEQLQRKVDANKLNGEVIFQGGIDRKMLPSILSESIAGLAPLKNLKIIEGSIPAKVFDYMACAIPFIAFGGIDLKTLANQSGAGFVVNNNSDLLADAVLSLTENPQMASQMGRRGREFCEKFYNRQTMARKIESKLLLLKKQRG